MVSLDMSKDDLQMWIDDNCGNLHIYDLSGTAQLIKMLLDEIKISLTTASKGGQRMTVYIVLEEDRGIGVMVSGVYAT